jgi:DnaK suppressor protein
MPAKKTAPKPARGKKAASRPVARKAAARKPVERAKTAAHVAHARSKPPAPAATTRKPAAPVAKAPHASTEPTELMRKATETAPASTSEPTKPTAPPMPAAGRKPTPAAHAADAEESEGAEPGSLLAGPRNVQPYIVKRGEQYMSKEQSEHFRQILLSWKRDLMVEVDRTVTHMKDEAANFPDPNDRATQEEEFSLELRTRDRERKLIRKIDEAIKRIEDGTYGYCLETGEEIGIKRLEARPVATLSIEAQERRERRERQYGDRDDRYR